MPVDAVCPSCQKQYRLKDDFAGKAVRCAICQNTFVIKPPGAVKQPPDADDAQPRAPAREEIAEQPRRPAPPPDEDDRPRRREEDEDDRPRRGRFDRGEYEDDRPRWRRREKKGGARLLIGLIVGGVLVLVVVVGIWRSFLFSGGKTKVLDPENITPAPQMVGTGPPVTEAEARKFGQDLEKAFASGDKATLARLYRLSDIADRSVSDLNLSRADRTGLKAGLNNGPLSMAQQLADIVKKEGGKTKFLRARVVEGRQQVVLRVLGHDLGMNYHLVTLARYPDGQIGAEDIYFMSAGEKISQ